VPVRRGANKTPDRPDPEDAANLVTDTDPVLRCSRSRSRGRLLASLLREVHGPITVESYASAVETFRAAHIRTMRRVMKIL
jgi:hypothetical protein